jgi:hypothetical protein
MLATPTVAETVSSRAPRSLISIVVGFGCAATIKMAGSTTIILAG